MPTPAVLGVDIGTSSSKGVLVSLDGELIRTATREHAVQRPHPGWVEMDGEVWWDEFVSLAEELLAPRDADVRAVGVSGMGPCVLLVDEDGVPLRPAILYGVDTRSTEQIRSLTERWGETAILERCGSVLSTQAAGAKVRWVAENEQSLFERARRLYMPSSWLVRHLTAEYLLDHHSASQCTPMHDSAVLAWYAPWADAIRGDIELPPLKWPGEVAGNVGRLAHVETGLPLGIPVITGTIDAWAEALSVGAQDPGDLMLMYGTTMFLVNTVTEARTHPALWGTIGALPGTRNLAGGMATSGAITAWLRDLFGGASYEQLFAEAAASEPGANGLLMLPYFAGERTPIMDPDARGIIAGLTLSHTRGDIFRAALEAIGFGVRHNVELMAEFGDVRRVVAVGGGAQGTLWTQIVSDITGREQQIPTHTVGAAFGSAWLAANAIGEADIAAWNPIAEVRTPNSAVASLYNERYGLYRELYEKTAPLAHRLAASQTR